MELRTVGRSGLQVSRTGLGTMTWGRDTDEYEARDQFALFLDAGGTVFDTADVYARGAAEELLGTLVAESGVREDVVLVTKAGGRRTSERRFDASRRHLLAALDGSLQRLGTDYVDLWLVHGWDDVTPVEETLATLDHAVATGRARYVGVSNYRPWQLARAATLAGPSAPLVANEVEYSLLARADEADARAAAQAVGAGLLAWSPIGRGVLTGKYRHGTPADSRGASPHLGGFVGEYLTAEHRRVVDAVCTAAEGLGVAPMDVAVAWVRDRPGVSSVLLGSRTAAQLRGALRAEELALPDEIRAALDEVSAPA
ncbi:MAG: aldo/keto reductase [Candidatus Nanopelagicales bacterium]|nr:aldo/keto reductase [Candidatus Nanopelagicales bacterium]